MKQTLVYHFERSVPHVGLLSYQQRIFITDTRERSSQVTLIGAWFGRFPEKGTLRAALKKEWRETLANLAKFEPLFKDDAIHASIPGGRQVALHEQRSKRMSYPTEFSEQRAEARWAEQLAGSAAE